MALADTARLVASLELQDKFSRPIGQAEQSLGRLEHRVGGLGRAFDTALGFIGAQVVMRGASTIFNQIKDAAIGMNATLETSTLQFETLFGGDTQRAAEHVRELFEFAAKTPFETGPIIEASRIMQTFGGDALNSTENLTAFGDAAAATSTDISEVAFWSSRMYANLQAGRPFGEAAQRLGELGILTPQVRNELEELQEAGADGEDIWKAYRRELGRFGGAMERQAGTWKGLTSSIKDNIAILGATSFKPIFDTAKAGMEDLLAFLSTPEATAAAESFARKLAEVVNPANLRELVDNIKQLADDYGPKIAGVFENIPWDTMKTSFQIMGTGSKALLDAFLGLPDWVQTAVLTGWGLNQLTGGVLGDIGSSLFGQFFARGASPANPMWVASVGGGPGGGPGGGGGKFPPFLLPLGAFLTALTLGEATRGGGEPDISVQIEKLRIALQQGNPIGLDEGDLTGITRGAVTAALSDPTFLAGLRGNQEEQLRELLGIEGEISTKIGGVQESLSIGESGPEEIKKARQAAATAAALRERDAAAQAVRETRFQEGLNDINSGVKAVAGKDFAPKVAVTVTSNVSITDITRRLQTQKIAISGTVIGGATADAP